MSQCVCFFFFKQKTAYEMRISDWSSDVCSSDRGPSPKWLQDRLTAIGLRPISALVDITNYVTFDLGRPLHVFDAARLAGDLVMRFARDGEAIEAIDGREYALADGLGVMRSEERRVGTGCVSTCRSRWTSHP